jgi:hypothetical protein
MCDTSRLEVKVARPADLDIVSTFFGRTVYGARRVGPDRLELDPPEDLECRVMRREVEVYLRMIERWHPGVSVSFAD